MAIERAVILGALALPFVLISIFLLLKKPILSVWALILFLPFHSVIMTILFVKFGLPVFIVKAISAWKEALLLVVFFAVILRLSFRRLPICLTAIDIVTLLWLGLVFFYLVFQNFFLGGEIGLAARLFGARDWLVLLLPYWVGRLFFVSEKNIKYSLQLILLIGISTSLIGIFEYFFIPIEWHVNLGVPRYFSELLNLNYPNYLFGLPPNYWIGFSSGNIRRSVSTYLSAQGFAIPFLIIYPLVIYSRFGKSEVNSSSQIKQNVVVIICSIALLLTITRMTIVACIIQSLLLLWFLRRSRKVFQIILVLLVGISIFLVINASFRESVILTITLQDDSSVTRPSQWKEGIQQLIDHPLGLGLGTTGQSASQFGTGGAGQEAGYLLITGAMGIPGLIIYAVWFAGVGLYSYWGYRKYSAERRKLALLTLIILLGFLINNLTAPPTQSPFFVYIFGWFAGVSVQQTAMYRILARLHTSKSIPVKFIPVLQSN